MIDKYLPAFCTINTSYRPLSTQYFPLRSSDVGIPVIWLLLLYQCLAERTQRSHRIENGF